MLLSLNTNYGVNAEVYIPKFLVIEYFTMRDVKRYYNVYHLIKVIIFKRDWEGPCIMKHSTHGLFQLLSGRSLRNICSKIIRLKHSFFPKDLRISLPTHIKQKTLLIVGACNIVNRLLL